MKSRTEKLLKTSTMILALFAVSGSIISFIQTIGYEKEATKFQSDQITDRYELIRSTIDSSFSDLSRVKEDLKYMKKLYNSLTTATQPKDVIRFARLESRITKIEEGLGNLNSVILDNPRKALDLILVKQELENLKNEIEARKKYAGKDIS